MSKALRAVVTSTAIVFLCLAGPATAEEKKPRPAEPAPINDAVISPDGKHVAAVVPTLFGNKVELVSTTDFKSRAIVHTKVVVEGYDKVLKAPQSVKWINSKWLAVNYLHVAEAIDLDGKRVADLGTHVIGHAAWLTPDEPLMLVYDDDDHQSMSVVNVQTKQWRKVRYPMTGKPMSWAFDGHGQLRVMVLANSEFWNDRTRLSYWHRESADAQWTKIDDRGLNEDHWEPLAATGPNELLIYSREGRDTWAVFTYDPTTRQRKEMVAGHPKEDIAFVAGLHLERPAVVVTGGLKPSRYWLEPRWAEVQSEVDKALPNHINILSGNPAGLVLIFSHSDVDPGRWFLLDTSTWSMKLLLVARMGVDPAKMRPMEAITYKAPDGLVIPAYLTRPASKAGAAAPMVVVVHGGPATRDHWLWDPEVQELAERGYVVFQPQFRGSTGFGRAFEEAGFGQWGLAMQDDITAGVEHLIREGIADPQRICIYGASYGGYAAVWGLVKTPELYRCGVSLAGVSDIGHMLSDWSDTNSDKRAREMLRMRVGEKERDKLKFDAVSPLKHAQRIRAPLLVAHGELDLRVPISHARKLVSALEEHGKPHQWMPLNGDGHNLFWNRGAFKKALLTFLDKHLKTDDLPVSTNAQGDKP
jgi:dipeptidyl aminopeptidase/acylaminoacyl peptidase